MPTRVRDSAGYRYRAGCLCFDARDPSRVLLISSRGAKGKLTLPAGGCEAGESSDVAASREAHEEAGALGVVLLPLAVVHDHDKRARTTVYALGVDEVLEGGYAEAGERARLWMSLPEAGAGLSSFPAQLAAFACGMHALACAEGGGDPLAPVLAWGGGGETGSACLAASVAAMAAVLARGRPSTGRGGGRSGGGAGTGPLDDAHVSAPREAEGALPPVKVRVGEGEEEEGGDVDDDALLPQYDVWGSLGGGGSKGEPLSRQRPQHLLASPHASSCTHIGMAALTLIAAAAAALSCCVQAQSPPTIFPLQVFWSLTHSDNAVVATQASAASLDSTYTFYGDDLYVISNTTDPGNGAVALNFYSNAQTQHHLTTASAQGNAWALANGYALQRVEGYVYPADVDGTMMPLEMWYSAARGDHFLVGTPDNRANAQGAGYVLLYVDSFVPLQWVVWPSVVPPGCPFPPSTDLLDFEYAYGRAAVPPGIGADTWYPTWTDVLDPSGSSIMLSSWTDGSVNGVGSSSGNTHTHNATTGIAVVRGESPWNLTITNVSTFTESAWPYQGRYPSISTFFNGTWYYGAYALDNFDADGVNPGPDCGNWCVLGPVGDIRTSTDMGATWTSPRQNMTSFLDNVWGEEAVNNSKVVMGAPHAVDFGQNMAHSPDGRMYLVATGATGPGSYQSWMQGDSVHLARTVASPDPTRINDGTFWEFYTGGHGSGATWSAPGDVSSAIPLFTWPNRTGVVTCSYNPALGKYLMVVSTPTNSPYTVYHFDTYLLEADDITGPFALISYLPSYGPQAYFVHWPTKFMSANVSGGDGHPSSLPTRVAVPGEHGMGGGVGALTAPLPPTPAGATGGAAAYATSYLSYSGNFASGYVPNPPGTGYHWTLQLSRMQLGAGFAQALRERAAAA